MNQKVAIVTGASGGLGLPIVQRLWTAGYAVIAIAHSTALPWNARERYDSCALDLEFMERDTIEDRLAPLLERYRSRVDLLVTAHGAAPVLTPSLEIDTATFERLYRTDVLGTLRMAQVVAPAMMAKRRGSMVFVSSAHAYATFPERTLYAGAKTSVVGMARALAVEWGQYNIRVNSISPWQVEGKRTQSFIDKAKEDGIDLLELYKSKSPLKRLVSPDDIAQTVLYLAENQSVTGTDIIVDCGVLSSMWHKAF